ncbi:MAG: hypothetical protein JRM88_06655 [Nitrososphaerota archaeon]|nr:hypothetical protein [Nitrososphaerota archaeon]
MADAKRRSALRRRVRFEIRAASSPGLEAHQLEPPDPLEGADVAGET